MIWFTWRQHRIEALIGSIVFLLLGCVVVITGLSVRSLYEQLGLTKCVFPTPQCYQSLATFNSQVEIIAFGNSTFYNLFLILLFALLPLVGVFLGAPAGARELEQGMHRLIWTQGIPWYRWLVAKVGLLSMATLCVFVLLSLLLSWWSDPLSNVLTTIWRFYDIRGVVLPAYAIFSFVLGFSAGIVFQRTVPAIAVALVVFVLARILIEIFWRPYFLPPLYIDSSIPSSAQLPAQSWGIASEIIDRNGNVVPDSAAVCNSTVYPAGLVTSPVTSSADSATCWDRHGFRLRDVYQPEDRFWLFQGFESGIFLLLAVGCFVLTYWWVKHKVI